MKRHAEHAINDLFIKRWSPRAMSGETITHEELLSLFEAARWAPSSFDNQPWRFIYAQCNTKYWDTLFNLLVDANKSWAKNAAVLLLIISRTTFEYNDKPARTHSFDTGSAWENLALQGSTMGLVVHGMEGFDYDKARELLHIPNNYTIEAMVAIGKPGNINVLSPEQQKAETPSDRKKVEEFISEGVFNFK
jgi:nitroreductase